MWALSAVDSGDVHLFEPGENYGYIAMGFSGFRDEESHEHRFGHVPHIALGVRWSGDDLSLGFELPVYIPRRNLSTPLLGTRLAVCGTTTWRAGDCGSFDTTAPHPD